MREYLFVSLFKACAESLASENASRLAAMQRAEKNIDELVGNLNQTFRRLRQTSIDEELFDVLSGYESLSSENASRLAAMQRAEKNIDELLGTLNQTFRRLRQTSIDEELFDVLSGYESLSKGKDALRGEITTTNTRLVLMLRMTRQRKGFQIVLESGLDPDYVSA